MTWQARIAAYIHARIPSADAVEVIGIHGMPAGASNETIGFDLSVTVSGRQFQLPVVLRPERQAGILAPYDISRQFRVMRALKGAGVPVPSVYWYEPDVSVIGAPFYFMERIQGETLPLLWYGSTSERLQAVAAALARIHQVDYCRHGLEFLAPHSAPTPLDAELASWEPRLERLGLVQQPVIAALGDFLQRNQPADARFALLHGDPNPGNYLIRENDVVAVLDWELAAIGDPRSDLGFYAALSDVFGGMPSGGGATVLSDAYARATGVPLHSLDYYEALGLYRMAVVISGWAGHAGLGWGLELIARRLSVLFGPRWAA